MRSIKKDMTGQRIGRLFVLKDSGKRYPKTSFNRKDKDNDK